MITNWNIDFWISTNCKDVHYRNKCLNSNCVEFIHTYFFIYVGVQKEIWDAFYSQNIKIGEGKYFLYTSYSLNVFFIENIKPCLWSIFGGFKVYYDL